VEHPCSIYETISSWLLQAVWWLQQTQRPVAVELKGLGGFAHRLMCWLLLLLSYALGAITGQPGNGIIVCRV